MRFLVERDSYALEAEFVLLFYCLCSLHSGTHHLDMLKPISTMSIAEYNCIYRPVPGADLGYC